MEFQFGQVEHEVPVEGQRAVLRGDVSARNDHLGSTTTQLLSSHTLAK